ncbi:MAG: LptF/LptG family permease [Bacteriovoracia bacterium]
MIKRYQTYILSEVIQFFVPSALIIFFTFFVFQSLRLSNFLIVHQVPLKIVAKIAFCLLISFSSLVLPVAFLLSVIVAFGRLSTEQEIGAMRACGLSPWQVASPVIFIGSAFSMAAFIIGMELAPLGERVLTKSIFEAEARKIAGSIQPGTFNKDFFGMLIFTEKVHPTTRALDRVFIFDDRDPNNPFVVVAPRGNMQSTISDNGLNHQALLKLYRGNIYQIGEGSENSSRMDFSEYSVFMELSSSEIATPDIPRTASLKTLLERMDRRDYVTEFWKRVSTSFSPLIFCFLGIGLGTVRVRSSKQVGTIFSLVVCLIYWETLVVSIGMAQKGSLPVWLALQIPNVITGLMAAVLWRNVQK